MTAERAVPDADVRRRALEPDRSFLVQAPAGSGKTELLIQRYLRLLTVVGDPEEILAITFTRKAAAEMRTRILCALASARRSVAPVEPHLLVGYKLAERVLARDRDRDWRLDEQPSRLRIGTIDSVNAWLGRRAPLSAGFTSSNEVVEDAEPLFRAAAQQTIAFAGERDDFGKAVATALIHCDNRVDRLGSLLARMLARRDQWMRRTGAGLTVERVGLRSQLEATLAELVERSLVETRGLISDRLAASIIDVLSYAGCSISIEQPASPLVKWRDMDGFPGTDIDSLSVWRAMADVFLTAQGKWRKKLNKNQGFPPDGPQMKAQAEELIPALAAVAGLEQALGDVRRLPEPAYSDAQWAALEALLTVLPLAAANLKQVFATSRQTDFTEIAQEALAALGAEDDPTELRLALDYQVHHILLDEFQDTSRSQFDLLKKLTEGWQTESGRTLFLVGDPMQSIYRFREAEVGLFLEAHEHGIGGLRLDFLRLKSNFRSDPAIVSWVNRVFGETLPAREDRFTGAVPFSASESFREADSAAGISWHVVPHGDREGEAEEVVRLIDQCRQRWPEESVGVLVRSRRHASEIARQLFAAGIDFTGADLETLLEQGVVQDLLALTRALIHASDRLAWLSVFRAPWCGLTLADLHGLAGGDHEACLWQSIQDPGALDRLSQDGRDRLERIRPPIANGFALRGRVPLRDCVEQTWLELGGPATAEEASDLELADRFFEFLDTLDIGGDCPDGAEMTAQLKKYSMTRAGSDPNIQVMTMHKAKGLEFDTVILAGLGYSTRATERPLLLWHELANADEESPLVFAPINAAGQKSDGIYELLWRFEQRKEALELDRLLYVATTRARKRLHLFAQSNREADGAPIAEPDSRSLLKRLWPAVQADIEVPSGLALPARARTDITNKLPAWFEVTTHRMHAAWQLPEAPVALRGIFAEQQASEPEAVEFEWASRWAMHVGSIVHLWLQRIAEEGSERYDRSRIEQLRPAFRQMLRRLGTEPDRLEQAVDRVDEALARALDDERGRWILSGHHGESASELRVTARSGADFVHLVIDRTFVCENGQRWIVDYKTSSHKGGDLEEFILSETSRYKDQLKLYRDTLASHEDRPIRTALYFPLLGVFREVDVDQTVSDTVFPG